MSEKLTPELPRGDIFTYRKNGKDGGADEVVHQPGTTVSLAALVDFMRWNPVAQDVGCIGVQTKSGNGDKAWIFFDHEHIARSNAPETVRSIEDFDTNDPGHDITIGQPWESPLGTTDKVTGVARPCLSGIYPGQAMESEANRLSATLHGRNQIDAALGQPPRNPDLV